VTLEETFRAIVREEVRAALREVTPAAPSTGTASPYLTVKQAAEYAGDVRPETVRAWIKSGGLARHGVGRVLLVRRDQLEAFLAAGGEGGAAEVDCEARATAIVAGRIGRAKGVR